MREWNTFFQTCIYLCITIIVFCTALAFVNALDIYTDVEAGPFIDDTPDNVFSSISGFDGGMEFVWLSLVTAGGLGANRC